MPTHDVLLLLPDDTTILRMDLPQYRALLLDKPALLLPAFAGRRVRFAHLSPGFEGRSMSGHSFRYWSLDATGAVDRDAFFLPLFDAVVRAREARRHAAANAGNLIDARSRFELGFTSWVPSVSCLARLRAVACGRASAPSLDSHLAASPVRVSS